MLLWAPLALLSACLSWLAILYVRFCWTNWRIIKAARALPTLASNLPILGMSHHFACSVEETTDMMIALCTKPGHHASCVWFGPQPYIVLHRIIDINVFLTGSKNFEKSNDYNLMKFAFADGLLVASGDVWKTTRRHLNPVFHSRNIIHVAPSLNATARRFVANLENRIGGEPQDVHHAISLLTLQNVISLLAGPEYEITEDEANEVLKSVEQVAISFGKRFARPWLWSDFVFSTFYKDLIKQLDSAFKRVEHYFMTALEICRKEYETEYGTGLCLVEGTNGYGNPPKVNDIRAVTGSDAFVRLQKLNPQFNEEYLKGEIINLLGTGTDTVAVVMASCLLALGSRPDIQDKVYRELIEVVGEHCNEITTEDANRLSYMDQVLKETMRVFTIVPYVPRKADRDIQMDDFVIPAGSTVVLSLSSLAKDPKTFPSPESFDPEHFSPENLSSREKYSFLPFAGGARDCIGKHYAMIQMKITISHILKQYKVISDVDMHNMTFKYALLLISADGYKIRLEKRNCSQ